MRVCVWKVNEVGAGKCEYKLNESLEEKCKKLGRGDRERERDKEREGERERQSLPPPPRHAMPPRHAACHAAAPSPSPTGQVSAPPCQTHAHCKSASRVSIWWVDEERDRGKMVRWCGGRRQEGREGKVKEGRQEAGIKDKAEAKSI